MATLPTPPRDLFVPNKQAQQQPHYGTDMRIIEEGHNTLKLYDITSLNALNLDIASLQAEIQTINGALQELENSLGGIAADEVTDWTVGVAPPAGTKLIRFWGSPTLTFVGGVANITLGSPTPFFTYGYSMVIAGMANVVFTTQGLAAVLIADGQTNPGVAVFYAYGLSPQLSGYNGAPGTPPQFPTGIFAVEQFNGTCKVPFVAIGA